MATFCIEGDLWVDLADFHAWLARQGHAEPPVQLRFSQDDDALVLGEGDAAAYIDGAEFWTWLIEQQLPAGMYGWEVQFGLPTLLAGESALHVKFAAGSESHPRTWSPRPAVLSEWKR